MVVDFFWLRFSLFRSANYCSFGLPCTCDVQLEHKGVAVGCLILWARFEFEVRGIHVQWNQTDTVSKDFILDYGSVIPDVYIFDGNCRDLVHDEEKSKFYQDEEGSGRTVPRL